MPTKLGMYRVNPHIWVEGKSTDEVLRRVIAILENEFGEGNVVIDELPVVESKPTLDHNLCDRCGAPWDDHDWENTGINYCALKLGVRR